MLSLAKSKGSRVSSRVDMNNNNNHPEELEIRPGGMFVQIRNSESSNQSSVSVPTIKVRVKFGSTYHEVLISPQASFGNTNSWDPFLSFFLSLLGLQVTNFLFPRLCCRGIEENAFRANWITPWRTETDIQKERERFKRVFGCRKSERWIENLVSRRRYNPRKTVPWDAQNF